MVEPAFVNGFVDGSDLVLLYRNEAGELRARRRRAEWSSFHRTEQLTAAHLKNLRDSTFVLGISNEGSYTRVRWQAHEWRQLAIYGSARSDPPHTTYFKENAIAHFEADVSPIRRFFSETGAHVGLPRRLYLDIETDSRVPPIAARAGKARVLCWTLVSADERIVGRGVLEADTDDAEAALLESLWAAAEPYDQLVAWFGDEFDFPVVRKRSQLVGARCKDFRRWLYMDHMALYERMNRNVAESGDEKASLALHRVAKEVLGYGKVEGFDGSKTYEAWLTDRGRLAEYNERDALLLPRIEKKRGHLAMNDVICEIGRLFADTRSINPIEYVDGFMLRLGVERGIRFPTRSRRDDDEGPRKQFAGAYVMEPKTKGIAKDVHVLDFSGMYPSIIQTWNMSAETRRGDVPVNGPVPAGCCRSPSTGVGFANEPLGILPEALRELGERRKHWTSLQASLPPGSPEWHDARRRNDGYKVVRNTFYGVVGSPFSRFFDSQVAESITQNGVWLIRKTIYEAEQCGMRPVYGDTDSAFLADTNRDQMAALVEHCNREIFPSAVASVGCSRNLIEIAYEKHFERIVFVSAKKYAGALRHYKWTTNCTEACGGSVSLRTMRCEKCGVSYEDATLPPPRGKPEIKGLEYKRGDASRLAAVLQFDVIKRLMVERDEDPERFVPQVERMREHVLRGGLTVDEVVLSQSITRPIDSYKAKLKKDGTPSALPAHVQVAKLMKERGAQIFEGMRIEYYVVDASDAPMRVAPADDWSIEKEFDRHYLWEQRVWPPTERLLVAAFPMFNWSHYSRTRPAKERMETRVSTQPRARAAPVGQGSLF